MKPKFGDASITGGVCYVNKRSGFLPAFAILMRTRGVRTLSPLIKKYVGVPNPENRITVYSEGWSSYSGLKTQGYIHGVVLHRRRHFPKPTNRDIHTQTAKRMNLSLKKFLPSTSNTRLLDSHLHQFQYFRRLKGLPTGEVFRQFISDIIPANPGPGKIGLKPYDFLCTRHLHEGYNS